MTEGKKTRLCRFIPEGKLEKTKLLLSLILSLLLIATAICFAVSCVSVYRSGGESPFSREKVASHLKSVAPISFISIAMALLVGVLSLFARETKEKKIPIRKKTLLDIFKRKLSDFKTSEEYLGTEREEKKRRLITVLISLLLSALFTAAALIFVLNPSRYSLDDVNTDIAYSVVIAALSTILIFAVSFVASGFLDKSYSAQLEAAREEIKRLRLAGADGASDPEISSLSKNEGHTEALVVAIVRVAVIAVAIAFIIAGVFNGGMADVLGKAVRICTECIGLG